jgi:glycosyltransferase involved in cell wall biosynthesis
MSRILFVSHVAPYPEAAGNQVRIARMMRWLRQQGHEIFLLLNAAELAPEVEAALRRELDGLFLLDRVHMTAWPRFALGPLVDEDAEPAPLPPRELRERFAPSALVEATYDVCQRHAPDVVLAEYAMAAPCLAAAPATALKLIDTHDVFSRRQPSSDGDGGDDELRLTADDEARLLREADAIIAIQPREAEMLAALVPEREVITVGVDFPTADAGAAEATTAAPRILLVGSDNDANVRGSLAFHRHAWPLIRDACPAAVLRVVGRVGERLGIAGDGVEIAGWKPDLAGEWRAAAVVINPTLAASGLKIKSIEALAQGKPLVATEAAVEGIVHTGAPPFVACDGWESFAAAVIALLASESERRALGTRARAWAGEHLAAPMIYRPLMALLQRRAAA